MPFRETSGDGFEGLLLTELLASIRRTTFRPRASPCRGGHVSVMRRSQGWAFVTWVDEPEGRRRQVWRSGFRTRRDAVSAERRFVVELEDGAPQTPAGAPGPTARALLTGRALGPPPR